MTKAEWKPRDWTKAEFPEHQENYALYEELTLPSGEVIATIESFDDGYFKFYANAIGDRSGCCNSYEGARQWAEQKTGNKVN